MPRFGRRWDPILFQSSADTLAIRTAPGPAARKRTARRCQRVFSQGYCGGHEARRCRLGLTGCASRRCSAHSAAAAHAAASLGSSALHRCGCRRVWIAWLAHRLAAALALLFLWRFFFLTEMIGVSPMPLSCRPVALGRGTATAAWVTRNIAAVAISGSLRIGISSRSISTQDNAVTAMRFRTGKASAALALFKALESCRNTREHD